MTDALVMAGGRISGLYARAAGTTIKALVPVCGTPVVRRVVEAMQGTPGIGGVCVVGPEAVREAAGEGCLWQAESDSALANLQVGLERLSPGEEQRVLLCGTDVPVLSASAVQDFLARCPEEADMGMPVIRREAFRAAFPGNLGIYVRLAEGAFTAGSQYLIRPAPLLRNMALLEQLFNARKSQLAMARAFGGQTIWRLLTRRLTVPEVEARASALTGCRCRAVLDCCPELAFDIDSLLDLRYIERWLRR